MTEEWEGIPSEEKNNDDEELNEEPLDETKSERSSKFDKLLSSDSSKYKLSRMFKDWFLDYSSYVILQRAVPHIVDGLKPVQRRVLHAMYKMDDGSYTKVANIVGQAMQYHPHGDASILGALVQLGQKGLLIDCQGNWGNILTGDSNAAPRYIEARLSNFAKEVVFDPKVTKWMTSYDGRNQEPTELPVRFPLLLAQGTEGIAVGMASKILPHNFNELLDASVRVLEGKDFTIYPDFPTGGFADCSNYKDGARGGSVKVRARIEKIDKSTIAVTEIPYGKTSQMLIDSILKAKDKGKIKIKKIEDMTTDKVDILIHLPNDVSPDKTIDALYAFTDCECNIAPNACVIVDNKPQFLSVKDILIYDTHHTRDLLKQELEIRLAELEDQWHNNSLERIFFENRIYKILEQDHRTWENQLKDVFKAMKAYQDLLRRQIMMEDILKLVEKPVRKISKFDTKAMDEKIAAIEAEMEIVRDKIEHIVEHTISWFKTLKEKYGKAFPRLTEITAFESIEVTKVVSKNAKLYANLSEGFAGIGMKKDDNGEYVCDCSDLSEIIAIAKDGKYRVSKVTDKAFFWKDLIYVGIFNRGDTRTIYNVIYRDGKSAVSYAKRFAITSVTRDKDYDITTGAEGSKILWFTANRNGEAETVRVYLRPRPKLKKTQFEYDFSTLLIKGKGARGNLVSKNPISRIQLKSKGVSTIGGKDIWYDADIQKLNDEERGIYLGEFAEDDKVLAIFKNGTFYTTSFDVSNRYQGDILTIEKFDPDKIYTALYYDGNRKDFYIKRFNFIPSDNTPMLFISEGQKSYLVALSDDKYPRFQVTFGKKHEHRDPEVFDAETFIAKKGIAAHGKKCHAYTVKKVRFVEPLHEPENDIAPEEPEDDPAVKAAETVSEAPTVPAEKPTVEEKPAAEPEVAPKPAKTPAASKKKAPKQRKTIDASDILDQFGGKLPDIEDLPDIEEPTLF
ncbi:MAG: DNA gyrase/topoisomerase IV subunit A [Bacteroidales bacterium]|jgi:topoisomerase-4 subunit A|nr:DNA gyrase/topoisomerase IV subunit A [Bacteroidota bacterium]NLN98697.1 DNA gyrase/topoisomerase IV subunit A [Bacteroidales bacterium]